jgi:hypothetical protein
MIASRLRHFEAQPAVGAFRGTVGYFVIALRAAQHKHCATLRTFDIVRFDRSTAVKAAFAAAVWANRLIFGHLLAAMRTRLGQFCFDFWNGH